MKYFVHRENGKVVGLYACPQPGYAEEELADDHPDVLAFLKPKPKVSVLYPVDLWSRMTNDESDAVAQAMLSQPIRLQNIFNSASTYRSDHELWPMLQQIATQLFGAARASVILAPSGEV